jgi:hypothetical protein
MIEYADSLNLNAPTAEDPNRPHAIANAVEITLGYLDGMT